MQASSLGPHPFEGFAFQEKSLIDFLFIQVIISAEIKKNFSDVQPSNGFLGVTPRICLFPYLSQICGKNLF